MESNNQSNLSASTDILLGEAESLIWALLDDRIEDADLARLTKLLEEHADVRLRYVDCVRLHVDLHEHFGRPTEQQRDQVVLSHLSPSLPGLPGLTPIAD